MIMRKNVVGLLVAGILSSGILVSCEGLTGTGGEGPPLNWEEGPAIVEADDSQLTDSTREEWKMSARELALRYILETDSTNTEVPEKIIDTYYNGIIHILNSGLDPAAEAAEEFDVRARPTFVHKQVLVFPEQNESSEWLNAWRNGKTETGIAEIDDITDTYQLSVGSFSELESQPYAMVTLEAAEFINPKPAVMAFRGLESYFWHDADVNSIAGDGSNITTALSATTLRYRFEYSWGDCPAGCINSHYWDFSVNAEGDVEYLGEDGDPLPSQE